MLYKFWCVQAFADESDYVGVVEAQSLTEAVEELTDQLEYADWGDYKLKGIQTAEHNKCAEIRVTTEFEQAFGVDLYNLVSVGSNILSFHGEDWESVFS